MNNFFAKEGYYYLNDGREVIVSVNDDSTLLFEEVKRIGKDGTPGFYPAQLTSEDFLDARRTVGPELRQKMVERVKGHPVEIYWDYRDRLSDEQVKMLLNEISLDGVYDDIWELNWEHIADLERETADECLNYFDDEIDEETGDIPLDDDEIETLKYILIEHVTVDSNVGQLIRNTRPQFISLNLKFEHPYQGWRLGTDARDDGKDAYRDMRDLLTFLQINPRRIAELVDLPLSDWPDLKPRDGNEVVKPEDLYTAWINCPYGGEYTFMLDLDLMDYVENYDPLKPFTIKSGARMIIHDYLNGASSLDFITQKDVVIRPWMVAGFYFDKILRYGIQSCCDFVTSAWCSEIEFSRPGKEKFNKALARFHMSVSTVWSGGWKYSIVDDVDGIGIELCLPRTVDVMDSLIDRLNRGFDTGIDSLDNVVSYRRCGHYGGPQRFYEPFSINDPENAGQKI